MSWPDLRGTSPHLMHLLAGCLSQYGYQSSDHGLVEVENHLGQPPSPWDLHTGETLWTYKSGAPADPDTSGITIVGPGWVIGRRSDCWAPQPCNASTPHCPHLLENESSSEMICIAHEPAIGEDKDTGRKEKAVYGGA